MTTKFALPARLTGSGETVWVEYMQLALEYNTLNLGHGFPDFAAPEHLTNALSEISSSKNVLIHQYTRGFGHPRLITALSNLYSKFVGRTINPQTEILVTCGAYEALFCAITGHIDVEDEVIIIEPFFDSYEPVVKSVGGIPKFISLRPSKKSEGSDISAENWTFDLKELESLFNSKTKAVILNTPNNPLGKVFNIDELNAIAHLCRKWNVLCISDEVYEWLVYKPNQHIRIASLPGMWKRTITVGSAGKTFNVTGWRTGWAYGPAELMHNLRIVHQNCVYACNTAVQEAIAIGIEKELTRLGTDESYFTLMPNMLEAKRDFMIKALTNVGMKPIIPQGGYYIVTNWSALESQVDLTSETDKYKDYRFTKWMIKNKKLLSIPMTTFYSETHKNFGEDFVRYCFIKTDENLKKASEILENWNTDKK